MNTIFDCRRLECPCLVFLCSRFPLVIGGGRQPLPRQIFGRDLGSGPMTLSLSRSSTEWIYLSHSKFLVISELCALACASVCACVKGYLDVGFNESVRVNEA
jgi:hypothetical protein